MRDRENEEVDLNPIALFSNEEVAQLICYCVDLFTLSRNSFPGLKCGEDFPGVTKRSPDLGLCALRGGR